VFHGQSRGFFKGLIGIERSAKGTDSFLGEFSMLLTKKARSVTIPSLEIDQPDVRRASHSSAVGPIDETQVFYLMSRGCRRTWRGSSSSWVPRAGGGAHSPRRSAGPATRAARPQVVDAGLTVPMTAASATRRVPVLRSTRSRRHHEDGAGRRTNILLVNHEGTVRALQALLARVLRAGQGFLTGDSITCALHLSRFDVITGEALDPPAELPLVTYPVMVEDGEIVLELPEGPFPSTSRRPPPRPLRVARPAVVRATSRGDGLSAGLPVP